jgi:type III restriction enzyme
LAWETDEAIAKRKSVDKRGAKSDEAYVREVLGEMANAQNIVVINDEAHHAWRRNPQNKGKTKEEKEAEKQATIWVSGLDRINKARNILCCYDFSATPFAPSGKKNDEEALFGWIVSDFGLNDGIEAGLVKTPRVVVRDDSMPNTDTFKSKLYHIYSDETVKDDINRAAKEEEPLPDLVTQAYYLLGKDWQALYEAWSDAGCPVPPVMITVANRTETAARIKYAFDHQRIPVPELCNPDLTLRIDSKTLDEAESATGKKADAAAALREMVDTVGQKGKPGEQIRNVISVGMLSEGWDAKTVTHILGLRAFSSQLLCEQVIGRGLRRTSYDLAEGSELFTPEYVNIFGIPFTFLPHESDEQGTPPVTPPKTQVEALKERSEYQISWPNIVRIDQVFKPQLKVDINKIDTLTLQAAETRLRADLAPIIDGKTDLTKCTEIDLQKLDAELRMQRIVFEAAAQVYEQMNAAWQSKSTKFALLGQVIQLTQKYIESGAIQINPPMYGTDPVRKRIIYMMNMNRIVQHLWDFIRLEMTSKTVPIFDANRRVRSTADMPTWYTSKPCNITLHSQISHCVYDSGWESTEAYILEKNPHVEAWAKNDHLGFEIVYIYEGVVRKYVPDYLVRLDNGKTLVLETKGRMTSRDVAKRKALSEWVKAVNATGEFGTWANDISINVADVDSIIQKYL